ncbi:MAG: hypothetical protein ACWGHH_06560 [Sulfurovaceae bacterium]
MRVYNLGHCNPTIGEIKEALLENGAKRQDGCSVVFKKNKEEGISMKAELAAKALCLGEVVEDDDYCYRYKLITKEDINELCAEALVIYKYRKDSGEFISFSELLEMNCEFEIILKGGVNV